MALLPTIYMDSHETNPIIQQLLSNSKEINLITEELPNGDFLINSLLIERKTCDDLVSSLYDNRLFNQTESLTELRSQGLEIAIILEGTFDKALKARRIVPKHLLKVLNEIEFRHKIPIIYSFDARWTANRLISIATESGITGAPAIELVRKSVKNEWSLKMKQEYILRGFRGFGKKTVQQLQKQFNYDLQAIFSYLSTTQARDKNRYFEEAYKIMNRRNKGKY